jgi:hypothetical protein
MKKKIKTKSKQVKLTLNRSFWVETISLLVIKRRQKLDQWILLIIQNKSKRMKNFLRNWSQKKTNRIKKLLFLNQNKTNALKNQKKKLKLPKQNLSKQPLLQPVKLKSLLCHPLEWKRLFSKKLKLITTYKNNKSLISKN